MKSQNPRIKQRIKNGSKPTYQDRRLALSNKIKTSGLLLCNKIDTSFLPAISTQRKTKSTSFNLKPTNQTTRNKGKRSTIGEALARDRSRWLVVVDILNGDGDRRLMEARGRKIYEIRERERCKPERVAFCDLMKWEKWALLVPQLTHVASCGWWRGDGRSMWGHPSTNYNSPHERVVAQVVPPKLFEKKRVRWELEVQRGERNKY